VDRGPKKINYLTILDNHGRKAVALPASDMLKPVAKSRFSRIAPDPQFWVLYIEDRSVVSVDV